MKLRLYISGKITGLKYSEVEIRFNKAEIMLQKRYEVVNPTKINPITESEYEKMSEKKKEAFWHKCMKKDLKELKKCQIIYMLPDYETSKGALLELEEARKLGLIVIFETKTVK